MGPYSPLIAALVVRLLIAREGFRDAHLGIRQTRWHFWMLALLLPFFWNGVQDAMQIACGAALALLIVVAHPALETRISSLPRRSGGVIYASKRGTPPWL